MRLTRSLGNRYTDYDDRQGPVSIPCYPDYRRLGEYSVPGHVPAASHATRANLVNAPGHATRKRRHTVTLRDGLRKSGSQGAQLLGRCDRRLPWYYWQAIRTVSPWGRPRRPDSRLSPSKTRRRWLAASAQAPSATLIAQAMAPRL